MSPKKKAVDRRFPFSIPVLIAIAILLVVILIVLQPGPGSGACGNSICADGESCSSCPQDCGVCPAVCGDGICQAPENCSSCPGDCGECSKIDALIDEANLALPTLDCSGMTGGEAYLSAISTGNLIMCACVDDEGMRENCKSVVSNKKNYNEAVNHYDLGLCDELSNPFGVESCRSIVSEAISKFMDTSPEQFIFTFLGAENFDEAVPLLENQLEANPDDFMALVVLSNIYADRAWDETDSKDYSMRAIELADRAIDLVPDSASLYELKGYIYEASGDLNASRTSYQKSIELNPDYIPGYIGLAHLFRVEGALPTALDYLEKAKERDVGLQYPMIYANLCTLQSSNYDYLTQAITNCQLAIESNYSTDSLKAMAHGNLGSVYSDFGRFEEAKYSFESALIYNPDDDHIYVLLAITENRMGNYTKAEEHASKAITLNPGKAIAYWHLAYSLYQQGKLDDALENALTSLDLIESDSTLLVAQKDGNTQEVYMLLAEIYKAKGDAANEAKYRGMANPQQ